MSDIEFPHHSRVLVGCVAFDRAAVGAVASTDGGGAFWAAMKPSTFLSLATPLARPRPSLGWLLGCMAQGVPVAPPELRVRRTLRGPWAVDSHEGRHRATAVLRLCGDVQVPVRISVRGMEWNEVTPETVALVRRGLRAQRGGPEVAGPLFGHAEPDLAGRPRPGRGPPDSTRGQRSC